MQIFELVSAILTFLYQVLVVCFKTSFKVLYWDFLGTAFL